VADQADKNSRESASNLVGSRETFGKAETLAREVLVAPERPPNPGNFFLAPALRYCWPHWSNCVDDANPYPRSSRALISWWTRSANFSESVSVAAAAQSCRQSVRSPSAISTLHYSRYRNRDYRKQLPCHNIKSFIANSKGSGCGM
jgi:hypothetical protein